MQASRAGSNIPLALRVLGDDASRKKRKALRIEIRDRCDSTMLRGPTCHTSYYITTPKGHQLCHMCDATLRGHPAVTRVRAMERLAR